MTSHSLCGRTRSNLHRAFSIGLLAGLLSTSAFAFNPADILGRIKTVTQVVQGSGDAPAPVGMPAATGNFGACAHQFYNANVPEVPGIAGLQARALCFDGFAVLHSGKSKSPVYVAEVLTRERLQAARDEARTDVFFADARVPARERASLDDYRGSGYDRGHMAPAADMADPQSMAQSFSLANIVPQAAEHNRGAWAKIETDTRRYVSRTSGPVYVITAPVYAATQVKTIGAGAVWVPTHLFKLVFDPAAGRAWAHWSENSDSARIVAPISYQELVRRTGVNWLPGASPHH